jgi:hypothetical protein
MLLILAALITYIALYLVLKKKNKYAGQITLYISIFLAITLFMLVTNWEIVVKIQYALILLSVVYGAYMVSYLAIKDKFFSTIILSFFLGLWLGALCILFHSTLVVAPGTLFFSLSVPELLWDYTLYAFFYPGLVVAFFLFVVALDNMDTKSGIRIMSMSILSTTLAISMYFSIRMPIYGILALIINLVWSLMLVLWEVWE